MTHEHARQLPVPASDQETANPVWLTLSEASSFLGIHFTTLRAWADRGEIRVFRTPGGHRRFNLADLRRFLEERGNQTALTNTDAFIESALGRVRQEIEKLPPTGADWRSSVNATDRQIKQERGRQLFALALHYVLKPSQRERILLDGRQLGRAYGREAATNQVSLAETGRAVQFFRSQLLQAVRTSDAQRESDPEELHIQRAIEQFLNEILFAVLDGYEQTLRTPDG